MEFLHAQPRNLRRMGIKGSAYNINQPVPQLVCRADNSLTILLLGGKDCMRVQGKMMYIQALVITAMLFAETGKVQLVTC